MPILIRAFTDGACKNNPGIGGWGWVAYSKREEWSQCIQWSDWGGLERTTNQEMELTAMAEFLDFCPRGSKVEIWSDSDYTLGGIVGPIKRPKGAIQSPLIAVKSSPQGWIAGWSTRYSECGAKYTSEYWKKNDLKHPKIWYRIHQLLLNHIKEGTKLEFGWVKGHARIEGNEIADRLANMYPSHK